MDTSPEVYRLFDRVTASVPGPVSLSAVYADLRWPAARSADRPYVAMNMVTTLDGKVVVGDTGTTKLIGSAIDHALMERINLQADAILGGASTVRADGLRYPQDYGRDPAGTTGAGLASATTVDSREPARRNAPECPLLPHGPGQLGRHRVGGCQPQPSYFA